jgi:hypothetical protein
MRNRHRRLAEHRCRPIERVSAPTQQATAAARIDPPDSISADRVLSEAAWERAEPIGNLTHPLRLDDQLDRYGGSARGTRPQRVR